MEENRGQYQLHGFMRGMIYVSQLLEAAISVYRDAPFWGVLRVVLDRLAPLPVYRQLLYSKCATLVLICLVSAGTRSQKKPGIKIGRAICLPLVTGLLLLFGSITLCNLPSAEVLPRTSWCNLLYVCSSLIGALLLSISLDNTSKIIACGLGKDIWNVEAESFMQPLTALQSPFSVNIPMEFYFHGRVRRGWINIVNPFRGTMLIGTPGSGKSFGVVNSFIRQLIGKGFCACVYDYKFPDLGRIAYHHYLLARRHGPCRGFAFHVINLNDVERSRRINPWRSDFLRTLADASESAEALVDAMKKGERAAGSDQFFTQSAINFLAACIYFFSRYQGGKYSSFPHVLAFLNHSYEDIFCTLFSDPELAPLLSPFRSAYVGKAFPQLEGQVGTLKIFISRLATKETFWVFSGDDFNLKISDPRTPGILVLANDPNTQNINSACYSVLINRLARLINTKGNLPSALIIDEIPTLYLHKIENLLAVARANRVAILMGLQELPQFNQQYGKETAATITAVSGNILAGAVRSSETLDWLERLFGKSKQIGESLSVDRTRTSSSQQERLQPLIPAGKIASLRSGELVGLLAAEAQEKFTGQYESSAIHCRVRLNLPELQAEEKAYGELPVYYDFGEKKEEILRANFLRINSEAASVVAAFRNVTGE